MMRFLKTFNTLPLSALFGMLLFSTLASSCSTMVSYRNFEEGEFLGKPATLRERGFRFWLYGDKKELHDELQLVPGEYMVGFKNTITGTGGASYCILESGNTYSFRITGRQYLPESGVYAMLGECYFDPDREENLPQTGQEKTGDQ